ncbi:MAG: hypothetical protein IPO67_19660 [Deltaproteobacteria bacterium]|nr:hypothetical protein [Deltaproteobacteria bacterium]
MLALPRGFSPLRLPRGHAVGAFHPLRARHPRRRRGDPGRCAEDEPCPTSGSLSRRSNSSAAPCRDVQRRPGEQDHLGPALLSFAPFLGRDDRHGHPPGARRA